MGGRGSRSKLKNPEPQPEPQVSPAVKALRDAKTMKELMAAAEQHLGIQHMGKMRNIDLEVYRESLISSAELIEEFPELRGHVEVLNKRIGEWTYADSNGTNVRVNSKYYGDADMLKDSYKNDVEKHFHPANSDYRDILVHEIAHNLERRMIDRDQKLSLVGRAMAWANHDKARGVVQEAAEAVRKRETAAGRATSTTESMKEKISRYAAKNDAETLAEAVVDYMRNREKAAPLSQEIWKVLKRELK